MLVSTKIADCYQKLFNHLNSKHGITPTIDEMDEIISISQETTAFLQDYSEFAVFYSKRKSKSKDSLNK